MTNKKLEAVINHTHFVDDKGVVKIHCTRRCECRPPKTLAEYENDGGDLIHDFELANWYLQSNKDKMPLEHDCESLDDWEGTICKKYGLQIEIKPDEYVWTDGTKTFANH